MSLDYTNTITVFLDGLRSHLTRPAHKSMDKAQQAHSAKHKAWLSKWI